MREYETVYVSNHNQSENDIVQLNEKVSGIIAKHGGRLFYAKTMGKRSTAYRVGKETKGTYVCLDYAAAGSAVSEIERLLRLEESILRFLSVVKQDEVDIEARAAEIIARGEDRQTNPDEDETTVEQVTERDSDDNREGA